jgi:hypothetical protein
MSQVVLQELGASATGEKGIEHVGFLRFLRPLFSGGSP